MPPRPTGPPAFPSAWAVTLPFSSFVPSLQYALDAWTWVLNNLFQAGRCGCPAGVNNIPRSPPHRSPA